MKLFAIEDDSVGTIFVLAENMGEAIAKWRNWAVEQSDCEEDFSGMREPVALNGSCQANYPTGITEVAEGDTIIQ